MSRSLIGAALSAWALTAAGCGAHGPVPAAQVTAVYDQDTGRLKEIDGDRSGSGRVDTHAYMDGLRLKYIAIDRMGKGRPDRWEYYDPSASVDGRGPTAAPLVRAEEANGPDPTKVTRWEYYEHGVIQRIEEDTDFDGKVDAWETYVNGTLATVEIDTHGRGKPDRRLVYRPDGTLDHVEADPTGTGVFKVVTPPTATASRGTP